MIKEGMLFLSFSGQCEQALAFYTKVLQAQVLEKMTYLDAEMSDGSDSDHLIMNATMQLGNLKICASDLLETELTIGTNASIWLEIATEEHLNQLFAGFLEVDSQVITPLETTFWHSLYCKVQDPFGIFWELNCQLS